MLSVLSAVGLAAGNVLEKRAVDAMAALSARRAGRMLKALVTSRLWVGGFVVSLAGLALQVLAFALAPLAVVQSANGAGLVLVVVGSRLVFRERLAPREQAGLAAIVTGIVLVGASLGSSDLVGRAGSPGSVVVASAASLLVAAGVLALGTGRRRLDPGVAFGLASGLCYGVASLGSKGASTLVARDGVVASIPHLFASPYPYLFLVASLAGLFSFQTGLQRARIGVVAPVSGVVSSGFVVAVGMVLFSERLPSDVASSTLRLAGFAVVLVGTALLAAGGQPGAARTASPGASAGLGSEPGEAAGFIVDADGRPREARQG